MTRTSIGAELRKRFKSPREALKKLGIDESVLEASGLAFDGANKMARPTRLEYLAVTRAARAINPLLLGMDSKGKPITVELGPIFKGLTTKNLKSRKAQIVGDVKKALKGKTIAKDATVEHLAHMLDQFEHVPEPKAGPLDESVSGPQHRAMEAAAHGHSNLGIPKNVGQEFEHKDTGKTFRDALPEFLKSKGVGQDVIDGCMDMWPADDEMPENALDKDGENVEIEVEEAEDKGEIEQEEAEDEIEQEEGEDSEIEQEEAEDRKTAKDRKHAKDSAMKAKPKPITQDEVNKVVQAAVATERKNNQRMMEAREMVRPWVGDLPMALDSAEKVYRAAATALEIEGAETIHPSALPTLIKMQPKPGTQSQMAHDTRDIAIDSKTAKSFHERFPGSERIGVA
jgi:hypothetical protein